MKNVNREELSKLKEEIINAMDHVEGLNLCVHHIQDFIDEAEMNDEYMPDEVINFDCIVDNYFIFRDLDKVLGAIEETLCEVCE